MTPEEGEPTLGESLQTRPSHWAWVALPCLPPVVGLALPAVSGQDVVGGLVMLSWPLPVIGLTALKQWPAAGLAAAAMAATLLAGLGWVLVVWEHVGCMYGLVVMEVVPLLGGSAIVAPICGLVAAAAARRRLPGRAAGLGWLANWVMLVLAPAVVVSCLAVLLPNWPQ